MESSNGSMHNNSNSTQSDCFDVDLYKRITGTILFAIIWPLIVFESRKFPLGRGGSALLGATLMVVFTVLSQDDVYSILGDRNNLETLFLLIGMILINYYFDREGFLPVIAKRIFGRAKPFYKVLWQVCFLSGLLSSLVTNDATCVVLTPVLVEQHIRQGRSPKEILPLLLAIATSANIGSAATIFGNPQNAFIAASLNLDLYKVLATLLPAALIGLALNTIMLYVFCKVFRVNMKQSFSVLDEPHQDDDIQVVGSTVDQRTGLYESLQSGPNLTSTTDQERDELIHRQLETPSPVQRPHQRNPSLYAEVLTESLMRYSRHHRNTSTRRVYHSNPIHRRRRYGTLEPVRSSKHTFIEETPRLETAQNDSAVQMEDVTTAGLEADNQTEKEAAWRPRVFHIWLVFSLILIVVLLSLPRIKSGKNHHVEFNLGLVPIGVAVFTMVVDALVRRKTSYFAITKIDWNLIVMFMGLFVWLGGFKKTQFPCEAFTKAKSELQLCEIQGVLLFTVFVTVGSNVFSNVPLVILIIKELQQLCNTCNNGVYCDVLGGVLLAWVSTISGNFTLFGSIANLIVAEKSKQKAEELYKLKIEEMKKRNYGGNNDDEIDNIVEREFNIDDYHFKFFDYLKFGLISTIVVMLAGLPIAYFIAYNLP
ncbi:uncharacterized protein [Dysidea avara]|uniref:uncharacterized protein n=1 Tax=Dysidea avara TaxID=196820 RepID=UPI00331BEDE9